MPILNIANDHNSPAISRGLLKCPSVCGRPKTAKRLHRETGGARKVRDARESEVKSTGSESNPAGRSNTKKQHKKNEMKGIYYVLHRKRNTTDDR